MSQSRPAVHKAVMWLCLRLRKDEDVKEIMMNMLLRLKRAIVGFVNPAIIEEPEESEESVQTGSSDGSEMSLVLSIGDECEVSAVPNRNPNHQAAALQEIDGIISKLYRLSATIRNPTSLQENARVMRFVERLDDQIADPEYEAHIR